MWKILLWIMGAVLLSGQVVPPSPDAPVITDCSNGASGRVCTGATPDAWTRIHGSRLSVMPQALVDETLPSILGFTGVRVVGTDLQSSFAPLYYLTPTEAVFLMPEFQGNRATIEVGIYARGTGLSLVAQSSRWTLSREPTALGAFLSEEGVPLITDAAGTIVRHEERLAEGRIYSLWFTGGGRVDRRVYPPRTVQSIMLSFEGARIETLFVGLAPQHQGVYQIDFRPLQDINVKWKGALSAGKDVFAF